VLSRPLTYQFIYAETMQVLYERSQFSFNSLDTLGGFCWKMVKHHPFKAGSMQALHSLGIYLGNLTTKAGKKIEMGGNG
jgi:hypothetical protein